MVQPLIGITTVHVRGEDGRMRDGLVRLYSDAILQAGGLPVLIPLHTLELGDESTLRALYERLDGVVIPGGGDVHPEFYGEPINDLIRGVSRLRDEVELTLTRWAYEDNRPILGICRGHQVLNVAMGGTLIHDIPTFTKNPLTHDEDDLSKANLISHEVEIKKGCHLSDIIQVANTPVNSLHHQAVRDLAPPLVATAYSSDGIVEGIEAHDVDFFMGVQWHPEAITHLATMRTLFSRFVRVCTA